MEKQTVSVQLKDAHKLVNRTDFQRLRSMKDEDIDYSEIPDITELSQFQAVNPKQKRITINIDENVIKYFKSKGKGYQTKINEVLKMFVLKTQK